MAAFNNIVAISFAFKLKPYWGNIGKFMAKCFGHIIAVCVPLQKLKHLDENIIKPKTLLQESHMPKLLR
jgi:hypothetical protein